MAKVIPDSDPIDHQSLVDDLDVPPQQGNSTPDAPAPSRMWEAHEGEAETDNVTRRPLPSNFDKPAMTIGKVSLAKQRVVRLRQGFHNLTSEWTPCKIGRI